MVPVVQQRLLELNRLFYATVASAFDQTRAGLPIGWQKLYAYLPLGTAMRPVSVLDAGCGNGRFVLALAQIGGNYSYTGVDADATLLALATQNTADLDKRHVRFLQADLAQAGWSSRFTGETFAVVVCLAMLQHVPGYELRLRLMKELAALMASDAVLIFSNWQFLTSARFVQKQIEWETVGLTAEDVEPGDALLPWQQGGYAIRYVHQVDEQEMMALANEADLHIIASFLADGKEGNLNLYTVLRQGKIKV